MNFENFMKQLDRTIDLSKVFVEYSCMNETAFWLLNAQIEDLEARCWLSEKYYCSHLQKGRMILSFLRQGDNHTFCDFCEVVCSVHFVFHDDPPFEYLGYE